jgi:pimeloyl-ACP methyl ester carboxylesterase
MQALRPARLFLAVLSLFLGPSAAARPRTTGPTRSRVANDAAIRFEVHGEASRRWSSSTAGRASGCSGWSRSKRFEQVRRVVAIDLAGHGESEAKRTDWSMEAFGGDVVAVCDKLKLEPSSCCRPLDGRAGRARGGRSAWATASSAIVGVDTLQDVEKH